MIPCSYRASACFAVLPSCVTSYVVSVRQARGLPVVSLFPHPASFGFHLTVDTLAFGCILPTTGRIRDFHPLETCAAGRTKEKRPKRSFRPLLCICPLRGLPSSFVCRDSVHFPLHDPDPRQIRIDREPSLAAEGTFLAGIFVAVRIRIGPSQRKHFLEGALHIEEL